MAFSCTWMAQGEDKVTRERNSQRETQKECLLGWSLTSKEFSKNFAIFYLPWDHLCFTIKLETNSSSRVCCWQCERSNVTEMQMARWERNNSSNQIVYLSKCINPLSSLMKLQSDHNTRLYFYYQCLNYSSPSYKHISKRALCPWPQAIIITTLSDLFIPFNDFPTDSLWVTSFTQLHHTSAPLLAVLVPLRSTYCSASQARHVGGVFIMAGWSEVPQLSQAHHDNVYLQLIIGRDVAATSSLSGMCTVFRVACRRAFFQIWCFWSDAHSRPRRWRWTFGGVTKPSQQNKIKRTSPVFLLISDAFHFIYMATFSICFYLFFTFIDLISLFFTAHWNGTHQHAMFGCLFLLQNKSI